MRISRSVPFVVAGIDEAQQNVENSYTFALAGALRFMVIAETLHKNNEVSDTTCTGHLLCFAVDLVTGVEVRS